MELATKQEGERRLQVLLDYLGTIDPERFDFGEWVSSWWEGKSDLSCGTNACALGWATTIPEFQALGLEMAQTSDGFGYVRIKDEDIRDRMDNYEANYRAFYAAQRLFAISYGEANFLFSPSIKLRGFTSPPSGCTVKEFRDHLQGFLERRQNEANMPPTVG